MTRLLALALLAAALPSPAVAAPGEARPVGEAAARIPAQLDPAQRDGYAQVFAAIRDGRWLDAQIALDTMGPGPLHAIARAELYTAKGSPKVELGALLELLTEAPDLPEAADLQRLARARGATDLPPLPAAQPLIWRDGAPVRVRAKSIRSDQVAADLATAMQPFVKADDGAGAEAVLAGAVDLAPDALTEWRQRIAWMYYVAGDDANARRMAALAADGTGDWAVQGRWVGALAAWRQADYAGAADGFQRVVARAADADLRAAALYWAARAAMAGGRPDRVEAELKAGAQFAESFYGQLAREALGIRTVARRSEAPVTRDWAALAQRPNVRVAAALVELGELDLADRVMRQQARIGSRGEFAALVRIAEALDLPATTVWLAHNSPAGITTAADALYPSPHWAPDSGWRVDRALVYAHALQESQFRTRVVSPSGAYGLMQIMPAVATDYAREHGLAAVDRGALARPSTNIELGQRQLERLRDMNATGGLLPKVIAAYNAGPKPVGEWNGLVRDGGDPLLYIESIPYWETRGYVTAVLRNYWVYEAQVGTAKPASRAALAQGLWPRFPGLPGAAAVRLNGRANAVAARIAPPAVASASTEMTGTD